MATALAVEAYESGASGDRSASEAGLTGAVELSTDPIPINRNLSAPKGFLVSSSSSPQSSSFFFFHGSQSAETSSCSATYCSTSASSWSSSRSASSAIAWSSEPSSTDFFLTPISRNFLAP
ncbi:hypothetical protein OGAPHI_005751 [Ogataea philodendri]|uniref:Uncharacterized protein n=1 Tax=Ogataea philodendri TaxID=1378263 RepID=A0A9P8NZU4_9ASCO|nr:uncharacterized protein OGAPHI_005751 [Ogataea philodendri]KAH3662499.1 hypothetical protein OGAPHI_005751 [Ogataea philodendri]